MPGPVLHLGAVVMCSHAGPAHADRAVPARAVSGQPVVTIASPYAVTGCALTRHGQRRRASPGSGSPARSRVLAGGAAAWRRWRARRRASRPARRCMPISAQPRVIVDMSVDFPYALRRARAARRPRTRDDHVRDLIEQVLFTAPGERVMRPDFGSGLLELVFEPGGGELVADDAAPRAGRAAAVARRPRSPASRSRSTHDDGTLTVRVSYVVLRTQRDAPRRRSRGARREVPLLRRAPPAARSRQVGALNGIEYVEVSDSDAPTQALRQRTLFVRLLQPAPGLHAANVVIAGGERMPAVGVEWVAPATALPAGRGPGARRRASRTRRPCCSSAPARRGDFSRYTLRLVAGAGSARRRPASTRCCRASSSRSRSSARRTSTARRPATATTSRRRRPRSTTSPRTTTPSGG